MKGTGENVSFCTEKWIYVFKVTEVCKKKKIKRNSSEMNVLSDICFEISHFNFLAIGES